MLGPDHPIVAGALEAVANSYERQGRLAEAEPRRKRAIAINERAYGKDHINVALSLQRARQSLRAAVPLRRGDAPIAEGLRIAEATLGPENPALFDHLASLGELYLFVENWGEAELLMTRALSNLDKAQGLDRDTFAMFKPFGFLEISPICVICRAASKTPVHSSSARWRRANGLLAHTMTRPATY